MKAATIKKKKKKNQRNKRPKAQKWPKKKLSKEKGFLLEDT